MKRLGRVLLFVLVGLIGYGIAWIQPFIFRPPLMVGQDAVTDAASLTARVRIDDVSGRVLSISPANGPGDLLLVFYPGGLVRPQAYEWLGRALAAQGVQTVIPEFFADLAVTGKDRADALIAHYANGRRVVIAGHSLGGAMAADYASRHSGQLSGMILEGAYPPSGVSVTAFPSLSLLGEHDEVADAATVRAGMAQLAPTSKLVVIPGSVHAFFGRYGPQQGDGAPTVRREMAENAMVAAIGSYLKRLG